MSGRTDRSERVVICDDVSWSEPTPRGRRASAELDPPQWMDQGHDDLAEAADGAFPPAGSRFIRAGEPNRRARVEESRRDGVPHRDGPQRRRPAVAPVSGYHVDDYLDDGRDLDGFERAGHAAAAPVLEYTGELDDESVWGPRPRLMADESGGRRTVVITGRVADRHVAPRAAASRQRGSAHAHIGFPADRTAMWAVLLCVILLLVALTSH